MRSVIVALCGLAALCRAVPVADDGAPLDEREFSTGPPSVTLCAGSCRPSSPIIWFPSKPTATSGFHVGRDEEPETKRDTSDVEKRNQIDDIVTSCSALANSLSPSGANSAYKLIIEECYLLFKEHEADFALLGGWTTIGPSDKAKRQEIIIGACTEDDIKSLTTQFQLLLEKYGRENIPYDIAVLLEAIKAALFYCALASPTTGPLIPDDYIIGDPLTPDPYIPGGGIIPDDPVDGGDIEPSA